MLERQNYLNVKQHLQYLEEVLQLTPASRERYRFYLRHLLLWAGEKAFPAAAGIRPTFPSYLSTLPGKDGRENLAASTQKKVLDSSKRFFRWAKATYPRDFAPLPAAWVDTLRSARQPRVSGENIFVTQEEVIQLVSYPAPPEDLALLRDQAAAALLFLSGMRAGALTSLPICALDLNELSIRQFPELGVHTKNSKKATTFLLNLPELLVAVRRWDALVRAAMPLNTPWYAPIQSNWGEQKFSTHAAGTSRAHALDKRLKNLFALCDLPFKSPHKFRHGHAVFGLLHAQTMADYKAVSMNLMHDSIEITDNTYAPMLSSDVQQRIAGLAGKAASRPDDELENYLSHLSKEDLGRTLVLIAARLTQ